MTPRTMSTNRIGVTCALALSTAIGCGPAAKYEPPGFTPAEAEWEAHHAEERAGDLAAAAEGYRAQCADDPKFPRACYDLARVLFEMDRTAEARAATTDFAVAHHENALAPVAVKRLSASYADAGEADSGVTALEELAARTAGTDVWDSIVFEIARLHRKRGDATSEARALSKIVARGRWGTQLWPDSLWRLVELAAARGDRAEEQRLLERLIAAREESRLIASYDTKFQAEAYLRLGKLLFEDGKLDKSYATYMKLAAWESSRQRDDAYYGAAVVRMRQGRAADACALLRVVCDKLPWSSSIDEVVGLMREARCAGFEKGCAEDQSSSSLRP
jgi:tetratricopeptide (TPR) repeat protein